MYHRQNDQKEILTLLKEMDQKIGHLETRLDQLSTDRKDDAAAESKMHAGKPETEPEAAGKNESKNKNCKKWNQPMQDLSQMQYELSNEITAGIDKLKKIILQSEKVLNEAKKS